MKQIVTITIILFLLSGVAIGGYFLWKYYAEPTTDNQPGTTDGGGTPPPGGTTNGEEGGSLTALGGDALAGYYLKDGAAVAVGVNGQVISLREKEATSLNNASFNEVILGITSSFDGKWFLEKWGGGQNPKFSVYDTQANAWMPFADLALGAMDFSPDSSRLAYLERVNGRVNLGIMDLAKKDKGGFARATIASFVLRDVELTWVSPDVIIFGDKPSARVPGALWKYTISTKRLDPLILERAGLWVNWDKKSGQGIQFNRTPQNQLRVIDIKGATVLVIPFLTIPDKCAVKEDTLYCAVPQTSISDKELPDAYLKHLFYTNDFINKVDIKTGKVQVIAAGAVPLDAVDLKIDNEKLYFINRYDRKLYSLPL